MLLAIIERTLRIIVYSFVSLGSSLKGNKKTSLLTAKPTVKEQAENHTTQQNNKTTPLHRCLLLRNSYHGVYRTRRHRRRPRAKDVPSKNNGFFHRYHRFYFAFLLGGHQSSVFNRIEKHICPSQRKSLSGQWRRRPGPGTRRRRGF